ncbi:hypothetical protein DNH61_11860 [Paenibacillus sambharensis]|uniref:Peptidoglycan recognition protein family domain-containing protein n=1 Tax=Paenibacillus sambharensis TaxID=1803190 RepID=A0A2W1L568_9BACL|nr:peptidoglycan recognition family protein [Paenibacillus sambharensis]PZD95248.1 hypothetical protein DNH61_11860 [Paenibacillus sambharensis]
MTQTTITSLRGLMWSANLPFSSLPPIEDITDQLPKHATKIWGWRKYNEVKRLVVHHMASEAPLVNQADYHVNSHNWPGIAYNLVVSNGRLLQTNDLLTYTTHAKGANDDSIGIAIHGDLSKREMTSQERELLYAGILLVKSIWPKIAVVGHNEVSATACPCTSMNRIRTDIANLEHQMEFAATPQKQAEMAYRIANELLYLYNLSKGTDQYGKPVESERAEKAQRRLLQLEPEMRRLGFLA